MFRRQQVKPQQLQEIPAFEGFSKEELRRVADLADLATFDPGAVLIEEGAASNQLFIILEGSVVVTKDGQAVATVEDGKLVGESAMLDWWRPPRTEQRTYDSGRRTATVTASPDTGVTTLVFDPGSFETLRADHPRVALRLLNEMSSRFRSGDEDD